MSVAVLADRFWPKVVRDPDTECWEWLGSRSSAGYGRIGRDGRRGSPLYAHRVSYELAVRLDPQRPTDRPSLSESGVREPGSPRTRDERSGAGRTGKATRAYDREYQKRRRALRNAP